MQAPDLLSQQYRAGSSSGERTQTEQGLGRQIQIRRRGEYLRRFRRREKDCKQGHKEYMCII